MNVLIPVHMIEGQAARGRLLELGPDLDFNLFEQILIATERKITIQERSLEITSPVDKPGDF
jgi:hypothetical protein